MRNKRFDCEFAIRKGAVAVGHITFKTAALGDVSYKTMFPKSKKPRASVNKLNSKTSHKY